jgi:hypothetical protein
VAAAERVTRLLMSGKDMRAPNETDKKECLYLKDDFTFFAENDADRNEGFPVF